jgi:hypothetical protein
MGLQSLRVRDKNSAKRGVLFCTSVVDLFRASLAPQWHVWVMRIPTMCLNPGFARVTRVSLLGSGHTTIGVDIPFASVERH